MYPAATSFIAVTVAIARFIEQNGFLGNYPYWYLGSTPVKYLMGPVVPGILVGLHKILPQLSLFDLSYFTLLTSHFVLALGWGLLALRLCSGSSAWRLSILMSILVFLAPWHWVSALGLSEVSAVLAQALTPWVLWSYANSMRMKTMRMDANARILVVPVVFFSLLLLTNSTAAVPAIVGILILSISTSNFQLSALKRALLVILIGWILSTLWYGVDYWLTILGSPSIGGRSVVGALVWLVNMSRTLVPVLLALLVVFWRFKPKTVFEKFAFSWLGIFGTLTLLRFLADWDFWMDWTAWMGEVEVGIALLAAKWIYDLRFKIHDFKTYRDLFVNPKSLILILLLGVAWFVAWQNRDFWLPRRDISQTVEYKIAKFLQQETRNFKQETGSEPTVFLSGTTAFWLNSLVDVRQVRGGRDEASIDPSTRSMNSVQAGSGWREAAWEIRSGLDPKKSERLVRELGIDYLVIHTNKSSEYYHDFEDPGKFEKIDSLVKVYEEDGDIVLKLLSFRIGNDN